MQNVIDFNAIQQTKKDELADGVPVPLIIDNFHHNFFANLPWVNLDDYPQGEEYELFKRLDGVELLVEAKHFYQGVLSDHVFNANHKLFDVSIYSVPEQKDVCGISGFIFNNYVLVDGEGYPDFSVGMTYIHNGVSKPNPNSVSTPLTVDQVLSVSVSAKQPEYTSSASTINKVMAMIRDRYRVIDPNKVSIDLIQHINQEDKLYIVSLSQNTCYGDTWLTKNMTVSFDAKTLNVTWEGKDE